MFILLSIVMLVLTFISYRQYKKSNFKSKLKFYLFGLCLVGFLASFACLSSLTCLMVDDAEIHQRYAEAQEEVVTLQADIQELIQEGKDFDTFIAEYGNLNQRLAEAQSYIDQYRGHIELGCSRIKFLLYFGS